MSPGTRDGAVQAGPSQMSWEREQARDRDAWFEARKVSSGRGPLNLLKRGEGGEDNNQCIGFGASPHHGGVRQWRKAA